MFLSLCIAVLYLLPLTIGVGFSSVLSQIPSWLVALCILTFAASFLAHIWARQRYVLWSALAVFLLLAVTVGALTHSTGGSSSPFVGLWVVLTVFSGIFGLWGLVPVAVAMLGYLGNSLLTAETTTATEVVLFCCLGIMPLVASFIIWHREGRKAGTPAQHDETPIDYSLDKAETVIRAIDNGVISINEKGDIDLINPAAQQILGWKTSDALGLNYRSVLKLEDAKNTPITDINDPVRQAVTGSKDVHSDNYTVLTESGKRRLLSITASPQSSGGALVVVRDITESKREEREQAEFISTASHEMRTPVASIEGYLGIVLNSKTINLDVKAREYINKAHDGAQHLGRLLQDLLDITKAEDGRLQNSPRVVEVVDFVGDITEGLRPKALMKGLVFTYKPHPGAKREQAEKIISPDFYAHVDKDHLREVVANLIENAIKYTPHGDVTVDVTGNNTDIRVSVSDSGIGIPAEDIAHLFQKFYRVDNSQTREIGGTGLGLYLSRRLTEMMGGRIWVESQFQRGSTFFIEIPRISHEEAERLLEQEKATNAARANNETTLAPREPGVATPPPQALPPVAPPTQTVAVPAAPLVQAPPQSANPAPALSPAPMPTPAQPVVSAPTPPVQPQPIAPAPTLATIEQNPTAYTDSARTPGVQIPNRGNNPQAR